MAPRPAASRPYLYRDPDGTCSVEINFCWPEANLAVLLDSPRDAPAEIRMQDRMRDDLLRKQGYTVLRYGEHDIDTRAGEVMEEIRAHLDRAAVASAT